MKEEDRAHLQVDLLHSGDVIRRPAEDEAADARGDADAQQQNFFIGFWSKTLLHMLHLWRQKRTTVTATSSNVPALLEKQPQF